MGTTADKLNKLITTKTDIKTAIVEKGVEVLDNDTFASYADKIRSIQTGGGTTGETADDVYRKIASRSFTEVVIPDGVTSIGIYSFYRCNNLTNITLPDSCIKIEHGAFQYCQSLNVNELNDNIQKIEPYAFSNCNFMNIRLPISLTYLGSNSLQYNSNLKTVWIPSTCTEIYSTIVYNAPFYNCLNCVIYTDATEKPSGWSEFFDSVSVSAKAPVNYGVSKEEYEEIVASQT